MVSRRMKTLSSLSLFLAVWAWQVSAAVVKGETSNAHVGELTAPQIEEQLQVRTIHRATESRVRWAHKLTSFL